MRKPLPDPATFYAGQRRWRRWSLVAIALAVSMLVINLSAFIGGMGSIWHLLSTVVVGFVLLVALGTLVVLAVAEQTYRVGGGPSRRVVEARRPPPG